MLVGLIVRLITRPNYDSELNVYRWKYLSGLSLGAYRFISEYSGYETARHEYGHTVQSHILGWLYLLVIGLPSIVWNVLHRHIKRLSQISYYSFYTEAWANILGGVPDYGKAV